MISSFIEQERTIILLVCPARSDLEADPAVELVKEVDPISPCISVYLPVST